MYKVLIITHDVVESNMAGPAIRCWEFARVLSREVEVTLTTPHPTTLSPNDFLLVQHDAVKLKKLAAESDIIILSGFALWQFPFLKTLDIPLVIDIYDPFLLESLPLLSVQPASERARRHIEVLDALTDLLLWGDFFLCSSERQRDYWLGWLNAVDRINPKTYDDDKTLRHLIDIVAFGLPDAPPQHNRQVLKGVRPGIAKTDHVIVWGGGVYNWFDPLTLIRAMERVVAQRDDVKLIFLGIRHPNPDVDGDEMAERAVTLSKELNLYDKHIFFNDWTPYDERQNYLLEADLGISLHFAHLETHFSFRTRLLDYIWASLPTIVTRGDVLSDLIEQNKLGWTVGYEDVDGVSEAILQSLDVSRTEFADRFAAVAQKLTWEKVMQPLIEFCRQPRRAPDRQRTRNDLQKLPALKLISQINAMRRDINTRDERITFLDNVIREREAKIANTEQMALAKDVDINNLRNGVDSLKQRVANLEGQIRERDEELVRLRQLKDTEIEHLQQRQSTEIEHIQQMWNAEIERVRARDAEIARLQQLIREIRQGKVMRLLDGINHILKGAPLE